MLGEPPFGGKYFSGDAHAGRDHGGAGENGFNVRLAPQGHNAPAQKERKNDAANRNQGRRAAHFHQLGGLDFQPYAKQKEHHTEVGKHPEDFTRRHPAQHPGADEDAGQNLTDNARLPSPFEQFSHYLGRAEYHQQRKRNLRGIMDSDQKRKREHSLELSRESAGPAARHSDQPAFFSSCTIVVLRFFTASASA